MTNLTPVFDEVTAENFKEGFQKAAQWLDNQIVETEEGIYWETEGVDEPLVDLYSGSTGILLFYLELAKYSEDGQYDETIKKAADYLVNYIEKTDLTEHKPGLAGLDFKNGQWAYNAGYTGIADILIEVTKHLGDGQYAKVAREITDTLVDQAEETDAGKIVTDESGILADGGIILYLIKAADYFQEDTYLNLATSLADHILTTADRVDDETVKYHPLDHTLIPASYGVKEGITYEWPNFEYGTAGVGFVFAKLYQVTQDDRYLETAKESANYIDSIAVENDNGEGILIPYRLPDLSDVFYLSYCHGPVGTARLYQALYEITGEDHYKDQALRLAQGLIDAKAPHVHSDGYWHIFTQCCGTAGFIELFNTSHKQAQDDRFQDAAFQSGVKIVSEALDGEDGVKWAQHWDRLSPTDYSITPGYYDGAAGIASGLLHLYTALKGDEVRVNTVDTTTFER